MAYFAGDVDRTFWLSGNTDLGLLLHNTIRWLRGENAPAVTVTGDGLVETFAWETEAGYALHLLNYTNPNAMRGPFRRFYPIGTQRVAFHAAKPVQSVRALRSGQPLKFHQDGQRVTFAVPAVEDYELISLV